MITPYPVKSFMTKKINFIKNDNNKEIDAAISLHSSPNATRSTTP